VPRGQQYDDADGAAPGKRRDALGWAFVCVVYGAALSAAYERSVFEFDRSTSALRWSRRGWFRAVSGSVGFSRITDIVVERSFRTVTQSLGRGGMRRLVVVTPDVPIPVTTAYTQANVDELAEEIRRFVSAPTRAAT
jgi:hypothetical protein